MKRIAGIVVTSALFLSLFVVSGCGDTEHKKLEDATEKEYRDFLKWDAKQQQKKRDDSPAFK